MTARVQQEQRPGLQASRRQQQCQLPTTRFTHGRPGNPSANAPRPGFGLRQPASPVDRMRQRHRTSDTGAIPRKMPPAWVRTREKPGWTQLFAFGSVLSTTFFLREPKWSVMDWAIEVSCVVLDLSTCTELMPQNALDSLILLWYSEDGEC